MFKTKNLAVILLVVFFLIIGIVLLIKFEQKPIDLSDDVNNLPATNTDYDQYLDREVPTSTILYYNNELLQIYTPLAGQKVLSPLVIKGLAPSTWFFEASFPVKLFNTNGKELGVGIAEAQTDWMQPGLIPFTAFINFSSPIDTEEGMLVFLADNPSGLPENDKSVTMPIKFFNNEDGQLVKLYFSNGKLNPNIQDCSLVFPVERLINKTPAIGQKALELLLAGVYENEKTAGYVTTLNPDVKLLSLKIINNIAYADFDEALQYQVGGSCRVGMIISQIKQTLKQFPTIKDVVISINGQTEVILQP
ncbi:MAG: hypothetical protein US42_C0008G0009 [Candidatus Magasanikbacteria bacterium GW2011_GWC2_37_14]|uniref:GerMN domain-containing protein n=1 Tax=Candidatus Magasanikbacteria bacterium GW2011_GWC2_37_14 TaxID=1619046 RepID=A0A0G0G8S0_9BACT|nr:MAG: hypothetical protein US42_C0008G0009 [Candidatus Magasanikbacteria bacterium GW2011_GWC2_37_14]